MEQMTADLGIESVQLVHTRRRRPVMSPVAFSRLARLAWLAVRPFAPLALFAIVFGLSLSVVVVVERVTPPPDVLKAVSSPAPG